MLQMPHFIIHVCIPQQFNYPGCEDRVRWTQSVLTTFPYVLIFQIVSYLPNSAYQQLEKLGHFVVYCGSKHLLEITYL